MHYSALILTYNEEKNIARCIKSLSWCDEVVVLDSYSSDGTEVIAREMGATVHKRAFDNYAAQRNYGINQIQYRNTWILMIDADEEIPVDLREELEELARTNALEKYGLFRVRRKDFFCGRWIKRSSGYPTWFGRVLKIGSVKVEREINEEYMTEGQVGLLKSHLHHFPFNNGFAWWLERHNRYSTMEAMQMTSSLRAEKLHLRDIVSNDPQKRRKVLKRVLYSLPFRPLIVFFGLYLCKFGFLDGKAGLRYSLLRAMYEYQIDCKVIEMKRRDAGQAL
jgi:glycosyltransferase involved in cell wall biosynthesis